MKRITVVLAALVAGAVCMARGEDVKPAAAADQGKQVEVVAKLFAPKDDAGTVIRALLDTQEGEVLTVKLDANGKKLAATRVPKGQAVRVWGTVALETPFKKVITVERFEVVPDPKTSEEPRKTP
jgi:hypothetical protein